MSTRCLRPWWRLAFAVSFLLLAGPLPAEDPRSSLLMVEGRVTWVTEAPGEGALDVVEVGLAAPEDGSQSWELLLAPRLALEQIGFEVEVGDHLKARIFPAAQGPARVHKVLNSTRRKMVRLRALSQIPLWDGSGAWEGGPCLGLQVTAREGSGVEADPPG